MQATNDSRITLRTRARLTACMVVALAAAPVQSQPPAAAPPLIEQDAMQHIAEHVYVILDDDRSFVPNVGIVVGDRATLIVDTGLGERNGRIVLGEARKVSDSREFYLAATHFHPEHDLGATAFPADAKMVRWRAQQNEADELGVAITARFAGFSPTLSELLDGAAFRDVDILFDDTITLDLGGVRVRIWGVGPNHTRGDTVFFVEEDRVLFTGDVVMSVFPAVSAQSASVAKWLDNLDVFEALEPRTIVPAHGRLGDMALIRRYREYLAEVVSGASGAKRRGVSIDNAKSSLAGTYATQFADLAPQSGSPTGRIGAAIEAAYREAP
jgi:glyoxylase-like metal-dependent hydrolase (beta-lactamase superfamily II)